MSADRAGVLVDVDGTLVDTTFLHTVTWAEAMRQHGHVVPMASVHHAIGTSGDQLLARCLGDDRDQGEDDAISIAHLTLYRQHWGRLTALPGAAPLLRECAERGLIVVLASSTTDEQLDVLRSVIGADDAIAVATTSADAETGKPEPDLLQVALDRAGLAPDRCAFVGDAVWDGYASRRAGLRFVGLTCGGTPEAELREAGAVEVWRDPADLLANLDRSLLAALG